ncbi:MAG: hypothetical protein V8Q90_00025 [Bacilli bacterium]
MKQYNFLKVVDQSHAEKIDKLTKIDGLTTCHWSVKNDMVLSSYIVDRANYEVAKKTYEASKYRLEQAKLEIESLDNKLKKPISILKI